MNDALCRLAGSLVAAVLWSAPAHADTSARLPLVPMRKDEQAQIRAEVAHYLRSDLADGGSVAVTKASWSTRWRVTGRNPQPALYVGFALARTAFDTDDPRIPASLTDVSVAVGFPVTRWASWNVAGTVGAGFAGDKPFADGVAFYGKGSISASRPMGERSRLTVTIDYDGNRGFARDWPLPALIYQRVGETLSFAVGLPFNQVTWRPSPRWTVAVSGLPPLFVRASVKYDVTSHVSLGLSFGGGSEFAHVSGTARRIRFGYEERRVELNATYQRDSLRITFGGGAVFDREFFQESDSGREFGSFDVDDGAYFVLRISWGG